VWVDTDGKPINAHGGGILYQEGKYYWYGEFKGAGKDGAKAMDGVSCYSSTDLYHWKNEGIVLKMIPDTNSLLQPGCILERPKVIYNAKTRKYVMWFHHELKDQGYKAALTGLAVADHPTGPFTYIKSIRPHAQVWPKNLPEQDRVIPNAFPSNFRNLPNWQERVKAGVLVGRDFQSGQMSRDMTLFVDDDGTAYHITSSEDNQTLQVSKLSDDYQSFTNEYYRILPGQSNEAPAIIKHQGKYYLLASGTTGWAPNPGRSFVADKITGPWEVLGNPVIGSEEEKATTFHSQSTFILPVQGKKKTYIYMGDRWKGDNLIDSRYIWLPLKFKDNRPQIAWKDSWTIEEASNK
ncbi:glycoside hydrolase family 43 protein, partial [Pelobium sp.]